MGLINYNKKSLCGGILSSSCVVWEGGWNDVIKQEELGCDASVEDVVLKISEDVDDINKELDLSLFNAGDLSFDKNTQKVKDLLQVLASNINNLNASIVTLQNQIDDIVAGNINVTVDLACLSSEIDNCQTPPTYSLTSILELLINKQC